MRNLIGALVATAGLLFSGAGCGDTTDPAQPESFRAVLDKDGVSVVGATSNSPATGQVDLTYYPDYPDSGTLDYSITFSKNGSTASAIRAVELVVEGITPTVAATLEAAVSIVGVTTYTSSGTVTNLSPGYDVDALVVLLRTGTVHVIVKTDLFRTGEIGGRVVPL